MSGATLGTARTHDELVDLLAARKEALGLSNAFIDEYWGYAAGMTDKYLGPTRVKTLGRQSLDDLMMVLGVSLVVVEAPDKLRHMEGQWERRRPGYAHSPRVSKQAIERALPVIMRNLSAKAAAARKCIPDKQRSKIASRAAKARWRKARARVKRRPSAPDPAAREIGTSRAAEPRSPRRTPYRRRGSGTAAPTSQAPRPFPSMPGAG